MVISLAQPKIEEIVARARAEHQPELRMLIPSGSIHLDSGIDYGLKVFPPRAVAHILGIANNQFLMQKYPWLRTDNVLAKSYRGQGRYKIQEYNASTTGLLAVFNALRNRGLVSTNSYEKDPELLYHGTIERIKEFIANGYEDYGRV
jgi:hypothetical protein